MFKFKPDTDMDAKLKIHIDLTVATPCRSKFNFFFFDNCRRLQIQFFTGIGADILDSTNQNVFSFGLL